MLLAAGLLAGCGGRPEPEQQIRALVADGERAAEERDLRALRDFVADDYSDDAGRDAGEVRRYLHGWLIAHQSIRLLTRIDRIEFEGRDLARLEVTVGMLGRDATAESGWDLAADVYRLDLRLVRTGDGWRVLRAAWRSGIG